MKRWRLAAIALALTLLPLRQAAGRPEESLAGRPEGAGELVPVPPVVGIPGPLFFETPTLTFVPKGTIRVTAGARWLSSPWRKRSRGRHVLAARASVGTALSVAGDGEMESETS